MNSIELDDIVFKIFDGSNSMKIISFQKAKQEMKNKMLK